MFFSSRGSVDYLTSVVSLKRQQVWSLAAVRNAGLDNIKFAWMGGAVKGEPHYYRIQGPSFLIEYDNTQGNANHVHSVWRDFKGDFGRDLLTEHYQLFDHVGGTAED